jgi:hypothetical protein
MNKYSHKKKKIQKNSKKTISTRSKLIFFSLWELFDFTWVDDENILMVTIYGAM